MDRKPHWGAENAHRRAAKGYDEVAAFWDERGDPEKASRGRVLAGKERRDAELERLRARREDSGMD